MSDSQRTRLLALTLLCGVTQLGTGLTVALVAFSPVSVGDSYWADLFRGVVILGLAIPFLLVPIAIAAVMELTRRAVAGEAGEATSPST
jgi:hypothetical protein